MACHVGNVTDTFTIRGRGVAVTLALMEEGDWRVGIGQTVELRLPDGRRRMACVRGIEVLSASFIFDPTVTKEDLPVGTELWTLA